MGSVSEVTRLIFAGDMRGVTAFVNDALSRGVSPKEILDEGLITAMNEVGEKFKNNEIYIPEVLIAAQAMQAGMDVLQPLLSSSGVKPIAKVAIGTVKGDLHDIGKNIVSMMLKGAGFEIVDFGIDVAPEKFVTAAKDGAEVIAMSSLITTSMPSMKLTIEALCKEGLEGKVKTIIGGAPVTQRFADEIGADGYADDAASAVDRVKELVGATQRTR
jgi:5-methyltetrahydrofolate--homocysteine methyltransferase